MNESGCTKRSLHGSLEMVSGQSGKDESRKKGVKKTSGGGERKMGEIFKSHFRILLKK
jgi:hypothetical protein